MRQKFSVLIVLLALVAACGVTQQQRELQAAEAIKTTQRAAIDALEFDIISAEEGEVVQGITRVATQDLKRAINARRAGQTRTAWNRIIDVVFDGLAEAALILEGKEEK